MAWRKKIGKKYYVFDYVWEDGKKREKGFGGFHSAENADAHIRALEDQKAKNNGNLVDYNATLWDYCDRYQNLIKPRTLKTKYLISISIRKIKARFDKKKRILDIKDDEIEDFIKWMMSEERDPNGKLIKKRLSHTTAHIHMRDFRAILHQAVKKHIIDDNVAKEKIKDLGDPPARDVFLTPTQKELLYAAAMKIQFTTGHKRDPQINLEMIDIIKVFLATGLRDSELLNLSKEHMISDFEIRIPSRRMRMQSDLNPTKAKKEYVVSLDFNVMPIFAKVEEGRIFKGWTLEQIVKRFKRVAKKAGMPELTCHGLRHTFASDLLAAGGSMKALKLALNHQNISTTDRYAHLEKGALKQIVDEMARKTMKFKIA